MLNSGLPGVARGEIAIDNENTKWINTSVGTVSYDGTNWRIYSNLPSFNLMVSEANGVKWFASDGLVRFNGTDWQVYNTSNSGLPSNDISSIAIEKDGRKWIGTDAGVASFDGVNWQVYNTSNSGLLSNYVGAIAIDHDGTKWFGTSGGSGAIGGIGSFDDTNWHYYPIDSSVFSIAVDAKGIKWFMTGMGVRSFDGTTWHLYTPSNSGLPGYGRKIAIDSEDTKWFVLSEGDIYKGIASFDGKKWTHYDQNNSGLTENDVFGFAIDNDDTKWISTYNIWGYRGIDVLVGGKQYPVIDNQRWSSSNLFRATFEIISAIPKGTYRVELSNAIDSDGILTAQFSDATFVVDYAGSISDKTPPLKPFVVSN